MATPPRIPEGDIRFKLLWVEGDADANGDGFTFLPDGRGDFLRMGSTRVDWDGKKQWRIKTALGNTFVFREVA